MKRLLIATLVLANFSVVAQPRHGHHGGYGHQSRSYPPQSSQAQVVEQLLELAMPSGRQQGYQQGYQGYSQPQPVYQQPVYVQPRPVYVQQPLYVPQTVYLQPQIIYVPQYIQVPVQPVQPVQPPVYTPPPSYAPPPPPVEDFERSSYRRAFIKTNL